MTSFSIQSFGCRVNQAEAFTWADEFQRHGLKYEEDHSRSDLVVVNTCSVTSRADRDARSFIRRVARLNPEARLILTGCFVERAPEELPAIPQIWNVVSNREKEDLVSNVLSLIIPHKETPFQSYRSRALVKIQDGCSLSCTFCIVPSLRGKSRSVSKEEVLSQVIKYTHQGFREIVLTGVHIGCYGKDLTPRSSLLDLIWDTESVQNLGRLRLSSLDPRFLDSPLLSHITESPKVCPHFHLSLQHGSDEILRKMGRRTCVADYKRILSALHKKSPAAALGADIIVGFPGESEQDFESTFRFLEDTPLAYFHVFSYSPRPGTPAAEWPQVDERLKKERARRLKKLSTEKNLQFRRLFTGRALRAIVIKKEGSAAQVLTGNYIKVLVPSCPKKEGEDVVVRISRVGEKRTEGVIVSASHHKTSRKTI